MRFTVATLLETQPILSGASDRRRTWGAACRERHRGAIVAAAPAARGAYWSFHMTPADTMLLSPRTTTKTRLPVAKTLSPTQPGAIKLARRYGDALICVRYRRDTEGRQRITTVELVVERVDIVDDDRAARRPDGRRKHGDDIVGVRIRIDELELRSAARRCGATWDRNAHLWRMTRRNAKQLGLNSRVIEN